MNRRQWNNKVFPQLKILSQSKGSNVKDLRRLEFISFEGKELGDGEELCRFTIWEELKHSFASGKFFQPDGNF